MNLIYSRLLYLRIITFVLNVRIDVTTSLNPFPYGHDIINRLPFLYKEVYQLSSVNVAYKKYIYINIYYIKILLQLGIAFLYGQIPSGKGRRTRREKSTQNRPEGKT